MTTDKQPVLSAEEMQIRFTYHAPKDGQPAKYEKLRAAARHFAEAVNELCPISREASSAMTHIENAAFWANAAIARREVVVAPPAPVKQPTVKKWFDNSTGQHWQQVGDAPAKRVW